MRVAWWLESSDFETERKVNNVREWVLHYTSRCPVWKYLLVAVTGRQLRFVTEKSMIRLDHSAADATPFRIWVSRGV